MRFGIYAPNFGEFSDPHKLLTLARMAEAAGWDGFFLWDHLLLSRTVSIPVTDAWIVLAAVAASTTRIRLGPLITPVARRRPWKLAREALALDHLSHGRRVRVGDVDVAERFDGRAAMDQRRGAGRYQVGID